MNAPKYSLPEIERRWLADLDTLPPLEALESATIDDLYIDSSRIRLRKIHFHSSNRIQYKLGKKYGKHSEYTEPIVNIYLEEAEYNQLNALPGKRLTRRRYHYPYQGIQFRINVIPTGGPVIVEAEFESEEAARCCTPPPFCQRDVSSDSSHEAPSLIP